MYGIQQQSRPLFHTFTATKTLAYLAKTIVHMKMTLNSFIEQSLLIDRSWRQKNKAEWGIIYEKLRMKTKFQNRFFNHEKWIRQNATLFLLRVEFSRKHFLELDFYSQPLIFSCTYISCLFFYFSSIFKSNINNSCYKKERIDMNNHLLSTFSCQGRIYRHLTTVYTKYGLLYFNQNTTTLPQSLQWN